MASQRAFGFVNGQPLCGKCLDAGLVMFADLGNGSCDAGCFDYLCLECWAEVDNERNESARIEPVDLAKLDDKALDILSKSVRERTGLPSWNEILEDRNEAE